MCLLPAKLMYPESPGFAAVQLSCTHTSDLGASGCFFWACVLRSQMTKDGEKEGENSFGLLPPMGFFFPSFSCSELLLLLHPAHSLPKSPRQCSTLFLSIILLRFEEAWIDDFLILKSEIIQRCWSLVHAGCFPDLIWVAFATELIWPVMCQKSLIYCG